MRSLLIRLAVVAAVAGVLGFLVGRALPQGGVDAVVCPPCLCRCQCRSAVGEAISSSVVSPVASASVIGSLAATSPVVTAVSVVKNPLCPERDRSTPILSPIAPVGAAIDLPALEASCMANASVWGGGSKLGVRDHVMLSVTRDRRYLFFAPLTALVWAQHGFHPIVFLSGEAHEWTTRQGAVMMSMLGELQTAGVLTIVPVTCSPSDEIFVSQMVRLYGSALGSLDPESWVVVNDIDMWPLWRDPYVMGKSEGKCLSNNAMCCGKFPWNGNSFQELPMGTVGMRVRQWRQTMRLPAQPLASAQCVVETMRTRATKMFGGTLKSARAPDHWRDDQHMLSIFVFTEPAIANNMLFVGRGAADRIDRPNWPQPQCLAQMAQSATDAHLPFPGESQWANNLELLFKAIVLDPAMHERVARYVQEFKQVS